MLNQIDEDTPVLTCDEEHPAVQIKNIIDEPSPPINMNDTQSLLETIKHSLKEISEINEARVLYFKSAIALNNYEIDCEKIIREMLQLQAPLTKA
jgi:negative regulator of flagellin synthesis FlgM